MKDADPRTPSKRVPVLVENNGPQSAYARLKQYSDLTGVSIARAVNDALSDWLDTVGAARLEAFKKPGKDILHASKVVPISAAAQAL